MRAGFLDSLADAVTGKIDFATPGELALYHDPRTIQTPALDILDAALVDAVEGRAPRLIFTMPPQEGKSQRVSRRFTNWALRRNPDTRVAVISYAPDLARRWGRVVRNDINEHGELGLLVRADTSAATEWQLAGYDGGMITAGVGSSLTGRPVDLMIIDDPIKGREEADRISTRDALREWWQETGSTRLSEGAVVVCIQTRWHEDDFAGQRMAEDPEGWRLINIPAQCETQPDILGRQLGEYMLSARGRTRQGWEIRKRDAGSRGWAAVYQGRPAPMEGGIFKRAWWKFSPIDRAPMAADGTRAAITMDQTIISVDATFKDTKDSDFVVMQVWGKRGPTAYLLDQVRARLDFPATCAALVNLRARWPGVSAIIIEDKANGPAIIAQLRSSIPGIIPFTPKDSKEARANAVAAFIEAGNVEIPDPERFRWVRDFVEEAAAFPNGANDDQVDAMTQALHRLLLGSGLSGFMADLAGGSFITDAPSAAAMRARFPGSLPPRVEADISAAVRRYFPVDEPQMVALADDEKGAPAVRQGVPSIPADRPERSGSLLDFVAGLGRR